MENNVNLYDIMKEISMFTPIEEIERKYNINANLVFRVLDSVMNSQRKHRMNAKQKQAVKDYLNAGLSPTNVASLVGKSVATINNYKRMMK